MKAEDGLKDGILAGSENGEPSSASPEWQTVISERFTPAESSVHPPLSSEASMATSAVDASGTMSAAPNSIDAVSPSPFGPPQIN